MRKLKKFIKNNLLIIPPAILFTVFITLGIIHKVLLLTVVGLIFMAILVVGLVITLKRYK